VESGTASSPCCCIHAAWAWPLLFPECSAVIITDGERLLLK
jgi:hypothetical protein